MPTRSIGKLELQWLIYPHHDSVSLPNILYRLSKPVYEVPPSDAGLFLRMI